MLIVLQTSNIEWATKVDATIIIILIAVVSLDNSFRNEESQPCADFRLWHNFVKSRGNNSVSIQRLLSFTLTTREALSPCVSSSLNIMHIPFASKLHCIINKVRHDLYQSHFVRTNFHVFSRFVQYFQAITFLRCNQQPIPLSKSSWPISVYDYQFW